MQARGVAALGLWVEKDGFRIQGLRSRSEECKILGFRV